MLGIQVVLLAGISLALLRLIWRYREKTLDREAAIWWLFFWLLTAVVVVLPEILNRLADFLSVGRGVDVALYLAVMLLFWLIFKLYNKINSLEKNIAKIVQSLASRKDKKDNE